MSKIIAQKWLKKAEENFKAAELSMREGLYAVSCFHSQQAAEMALKAQIVLVLGSQPLSHALTDLAAELRAVGQPVSPSVEDLSWLQDHYLQARYPNARLSEYTSQEAERAVEIAKIVLSEIRRRSEEG